MLLVAAQANVLDYGIVLVSVLSEASPFAHTNVQDDDDSGSDSENSIDGLDDVDRTNAIKQERQKKKARSNVWRHDGGDVLAGILATGAYSYAGRGAGGASESLACKRFCEENCLHPVIMERIQKMRIHLAKLAKQRLGNASGVAASSGKVLSSMPPPKKLEENLLRQVRRLCKIPFETFPQCVSDFMFFSFLRLQRQLLQDFLIIWRDERLSRALAQMAKQCLDLHTLVVGQLL
jgi:HrpA-like RNA helicase